MAPPGGFKWRPRNVRTVLEQGAELGGNVVPLDSRSKRRPADSPMEEGRRKG